MSFILIHQYINNLRIYNFLNNFMSFVSDEDLAKASDLDREWQRRRDQFHTVSLPVQVDWLFLYTCCWI